MTAFDRSTPPAAMSIIQAAAYLSISKSSLWRLIGNKALPVVKLGGRTIIRRVDLDALLERSVVS